MNPHTLLSLLVAVGAVVPAFANAAETAPSTIELKYDAFERETKAAPFVGTCPVHLLPTRDERQNQETIGANVRGPLVVSAAAPWVADGLAHLKDYGYPVDPIADAGSSLQGVTIRPTLTRAYVWQIGLKIFSMVALKVEYSDSNGAIQQKFYRAHGDKSNIWGADYEYVTTLNYGINNLLLAMAGDLVSLCKGVKVDPYTYAGPDPAAKK